MAQTECCVCQGLGAIETTGLNCRTCGGSGWVRLPSDEKARSKDTLHFHASGSCRGFSTLDECVEDAKKHGYEGKVLEQIDAGVKCYSLITFKFDHWAKHGRFVAELWRVYEETYYP